MNVSPYSSTAPASDNTSQSQPSNQLDGNSFMILLTAQLKSQDPFQPTDPTAFVGQLVQFNSLEQMIQMKDLLQQIADGQTPTTTTGQPSGSSPAQPTSTQ